MLYKLWYGFSYFPINSILFLIFGLWTNNILLYLPFSKPPKFMKLINWRELWKISFKAKEKLNYYAPLKKWIKTIVFVVKLMIMNRYQMNSNNSSFLYKYCKSNPNNNQHNRKHCRISDQIPLWGDYIKPLVCPNWKYKRLRLNTSPKWQ